VTLDPEVAAILAALVAAAFAAAPRVRNSLRRRRRALRECLACGRSVVFGERTCDCEVQE
jgi:hypothetical protein